MSILLFSNVYAQTPKPSMTVTLKAPSIQHLPLKTDVTGNVVAWQESIIGSELTGVRIESVLVDVGATVKKGQLLATLNSQRVTADYNQSKSAFAEAQANLKQAKENANRARTVEKTSALSSQQMSQYLTAESTAQARLDAAQAALDTQNVRLEQTKIIAPDAGVVSSRTAALGSLVNTGELFRIIIQEKLQWKPQVSSDQIDLVEKGQNVELRTKSGETIKAKVTGIAPSVNEQTRQGTVYVNLDKVVHQNKIKAGMFLDGSIFLGAANVTLIDQQCVVLRDGFNYVFVLGADNKVKQTKITLGARYGNSVEVKSGVTTKDMLVATGANFLQDQDLVAVSKLDEGSANATTSSSSSISSSNNEGK